MELNDIYNQLKIHSDNMSLNPPLKDSEIISYENKHSIQLPIFFKEMLRLFNGGEIYAPGIKVYGIDKDDESDFIYISRINSTNLKIPENYYIIAKLNYGDYICLNFLPPFDVIQWDNTNKRKYLSWSSLETWLESVIDFGYMPDEERKTNTSTISYGYANSNTVIKKKAIPLPIIISIIPVIAICGFILHEKVKPTVEQENMNSGVAQSSENVHESINTSITNAIALNTSAINSNNIYEVNDSNDSFTTVSDENNVDSKYGTVNTVKDPLNVRKKPSIDSDKIGSIPKGDTVTVIGETDEWYEIEYGDKTGYVSKLYVILKDEQQSEVVVTGVVKTKDDPLNVREQPNANSKILGTVPKGGTVSIISDDGEWYEIKYGSGKGYVSKKYVSLS